MEKYAIFNNSSTDSLNEGHVSVPIKYFRGGHALSDITLGLYFSPPIYTDTNPSINNYEVVLTINTNKHKDVLQAVAKEFSTGESVNIIIADDEAGTYIHSDIVGVAIASVNTYSWRPGHHGRADKIKILPKDFIAADNGRPLMINDATSDERWLHSDGSNLMYASVIIPFGFIATAVTIYGQL